MAMLAAPERWPEWTSLHVFMASSLLGCCCVLGRGAPPQDGPPGCPSLIQPADRRTVRRTLDRLRIALHFLSDLDHRFGESVQRLQGLGLCRLDHDGLVDDEREIDRRRVDPVI